MTETKLTPEQIKNWRNEMMGVLGPYALIMPEEQIQAIRDTMQKNLDSEYATKGAVGSEQK